MVKLKDLSQQEAEARKERGELLGEEIPGTETRWFNMVPIIRLLSPSAQTRYEWEIQRLAKKYHANAVYEEPDRDRELIGAEFPYRLHFFTN
ncbi:MAG: hypothetical protein AABX23_03180 [Nanoarchaeota archaeon]